MLGPEVVILLRLITPILIFRWPFLGGLLSLGLDYIDIGLLKFFNANLENYQTLDKILDLYYLTFEVIMVLSWQNTFAKRVSVSLFLYRVIGITLFEITQLRGFLFFFPNFFEFFFLFYCAYRTIFKQEPNLSLTWIRASIFLLFLYKIYQEFSLHMVNFHPWLGSQLFGIK